MRVHSLTIERLDLWFTFIQRHQKRESVPPGEYPVPQYLWAGFINMTSDRELSAMMDDAGGKQSDGFLRLTVHLPPEQLLCVSLRGGGGCFGSQGGMRCELRLYFQHYYKLFWEEPAQQERRTHPPWVSVDGCVPHTAVALAVSLPITLLCPISPVIMPL